MATIVSIFFSLNLLLFSFNLLPVPPMDGSGALGLLMPQAMARRWTMALQRPRLRFFGLYMAWLLFSRIFGPIQLLAVNLLYFGSRYH